MVNKTRQTTCVWIFWNSSASTDQDCSYTLGLCVLVWTAIMSLSNEIDFWSIFGHTVLNDCCLLTGRRWMRSVFSMWPPSTPDTILNLPVFCFVVGSISNHILTDFPNFLRSSWSALLKFLFKVTKSDRLMTMSVWADAGKRLYPCHINEAHGLTEGLKHSRCSIPSIFCLWATSTPPRPVDADQHEVFGRSNFCMVGRFESLMEILGNINSRTTRSRAIASTWIYRIVVGRSMTLMASFLTPCTTIQHNRLVSFCSGVERVSLNDDDRTKIGISKHTVLGLTWQWSHHFSFVVEGINLWRNCFLFIALPVLLLVNGNIVFFEDHHPKRADFHPYEYMYKRQKVCPPTLHCSIDCSQSLVCCVCIQPYL